MAFITRSLVVRSGHIDFVFTQAVVCGAEMMRLHCSAVDIGVTLAVKPCKREKNYNSLAAAIILLQGRLELNLFLHSLQPCDSLMTTTFCFV